MRRRQGGFTLLEVMIAIAILALSLVILIRIVTNNVRAAAHARMVTNSTFLARAKIAAMEDDLLAVGFTDSDEQDAGDFRDEGYPNIRWTSLIERIELPTDATQSAQQAATQQTQSASSAGSANPMMALTGMMGGFMTTLIEPIRLGLQEAVRRVTVTVLWDEVARRDQSFEVVAYLTDPSRLDMAMGLPGASGTGGTGGGTGSGGTTGAGGAAGGATGTGQRTQSPTGAGGVRGR